jgi:hypothetical protein
MKTLNLGSDDEPVIKKKSKSRNLKIALGVAALILIPTIGSTLAGTITIGTSNTLEFAQGVTATTACDSAIVITPGSTLSSGTFKLTTIALTDIINASNTGCAGKYLTLKVMDSSTTLVNIASGAAPTQVKFALPSTCAAAAIVDSPDTDATVATITCHASTGSVTVTLVTSVLTTNVDKITLESSST